MRGKGANPLQKRKERKVLESVSFQYFINKSIVFQITLDGTLCFDICKS